MDKKAGLTNKGVSLWLDLKMQGWNHEQEFPQWDVTLRKDISPLCWDAVSSFLNLEVLLMLYVSWSFCRAEMSRGGGARPLHSFSCPSLKRRLRAGRGTPDSGGGWLRGLDTPLSRSEGWLPSCQHRSKVTDQNNRQRCEGQGYIFIGGKKPAEGFLCDSWNSPPFQPVNTAATSFRLIMLPSCCNTLIQLWLLHLFFPLSQYLSFLSFLH